MSDTSMRFLTFVLGSIVLLPSAMFDRNHRPPAGVRTTIEWISEQLTRVWAVEDRRNQAILGGKWTLSQSAARIALASSR
jgi:hypothetical protein